MSRKLFRVLVVRKNLQVLVHAISWDTGKLWGSQGWVVGCVRVDCWRKWGGERFLSVPASRLSFIRGQCQKKSVILVSNRNTESRGHTSWQDHNVFSGTRGIQEGRLQGCLSILIIGSVLDIRCTIQYLYMGIGVRNPKRSESWNSNKHMWKESEVSKTGSPSGARLTVLHACICLPT